MNVVLVEPEIPQNTGNISRTCVMTGATLHLVGRLGFSLEDRFLKRAGLDYWPHLTFYHYRDFDTLWRMYKDRNFYFFTTHAGRLYTEVSFTWSDFLVYGSETAGLPSDLLERFRGQCLRVPMARKIPRSLNLSNSVALTLYEALRQQDFPGLE